MVANFFQDPEEHNLSKNKSDFHMLDMIITALVDQQSLSPLMLSWATIRYLVSSFLRCFFDFVAKL